MILALVLVLLEIVLPLIATPILIPLGYFVHVYGFVKHRAYSKTLNQRKQSHGVGALLLSTHGHLNEDSEVKPQGKPAVKAVKKQRNVSFDAKGASYQEYE